MEIKLKSVLQTPKLGLALKTAIFAGLLAFVEFGPSAGGLSVLIFMAATAFLYATPLFRTLDLVRPLIIAMVLALIAVKTFSGTYFWLADFYLAFIFCLILGVKDLIFIHRIAWRRILNLGIAYPVFLLFFYYSQTAFLVRFLLLLPAVFLLWRDLFKKRAAAWLLVLLILESGWAIGLLPLGFMGAGSLMLAVYFVLGNLTHRHMAGALTRRHVLADVTVFALLALFIFAFSKWGA